MAKTRQLPLANYPNGTREFGPWAFPNGLAGFDVRIGRCTSASPTLWPNASTTLDLQLQFSYDGGATWTAIGANGTGPRSGGIITQRGIDLAEEVFSWRFSPDEPTHAKATVTITGGPLRSYLDLTVL